MDRKLNKILDIVKKKKILEDRRIEFENKIKEYEIDYKGAEALNLLLEGMDKAKIKIPAFETLTLPKDIKVTVPCIHLKAPHPNGDTVTVPCIHKVVKHSKGHIKFGVRVPCMHTKSKHPRGDKKTVICTHKRIPRHPRGDKKTVICTHKPVLVHPSGDKVKLSDSVYGKYSNSLLGNKIPIGIRYDSPTNAFKTYQEVNTTGHKVWAHYLVVKDFIDSTNLPKQAKLWLAATWDDVTKEYRQMIRDHMKMLLVLSLQLLIPGIPIQGVNEKDGYKIKGDYRKALHLVKRGIDSVEINTFMFSKDAVIDDDPSLPPTHSEISKDHPKKAIKEKSHKYHLHGSIFYDIHFLLAKHAVQHITLEMNRYFGKSIIDHNIPDKQRNKLLGLNRDAKDLSSEIISEAQSIGRTIYNSKSFPLFDVVDYYISHPSKTKWWEGIILDYMKKHPKQVIDDINHRNKTRADRGGLFAKTSKTADRITDPKLIQARSRRIIKNIAKTRRNIRKR